MFERKLLALQYERPSINVYDDSEFQSIVYWIESMKIRFYKPDDRQNLMAGTKNWQQSFEKYLNEMNFNCNNNNNNRKEQLDYLLTIALRYEMEDLRQQMQMSVENVSNLIDMDNNSDVDDIDINSKEFLIELQTLSKLLNVPYYEQEPIYTLRAIAILLCKLRKLSFVNNNNNNVEYMDVDDDNQQNHNKKQKIIAKVDENILNLKFSGKSKYDPVVNRCANVLRLLYIKDLRELQTEINNAIVQVQSMTANPKTDSSLGQVGR